MKILWIGGNHPRHLYFINKIQTTFEISGVIIQNRENIVPQPPENIEDIDRKNFIKHFSNRFFAEKKFFGSPNLPNCETHIVTSDTLNSQKCLNFIKSINPDVVLIFGSDLIKNPLLSVLPKQTINLHLGISPRYRGAATLFWPFYFLEPNYAGSTFHYIISEPDAGDTIHQCTPTLDSSDGIHDVACKTVITSANEAVELLNILEKKRQWIPHKQKGTGKNFLNSDFKPEHLRLIYNTFNDDIVANYLQGKLNPKSPNLIRQF